MNALTSQFSLTTRAEMARDTRPNVKLAQPTQNAVKYHAYEARMLEEAAKLAERAGGGEVKFGDSRTNEQRLADNRAEFLALLTKPRTTSQIAEILGRKNENVAASLLRMHRAGLVEYKEQPRAPGGYPQPRIWSKASPDAEASSGKTRNHYNAARAEETKAAILVTLNTPKAPFQVAAQLGCDPSTAGKHMRALAREGRIVDAGMVQVKHGRPVQAWVRA